MSNEKVLCSNYLTIRFDQLEDNRIDWYVIPDEKVKNSEALSLIDLAECGAPLSAMGIRVFMEVVCRWIGVQFARTSEFDPGGGVQACRFDSA